MNTNRLNHRSARSGSVLVITLVTAAVMGAALAAVLNLTASEHRMLVRTADWNAALPVAEAGIEEAMSHLRQVNGGNRAVNGWVKDGNNYLCSRTLSFGRFQVGISATTPPVITSTGFVWCASANRYMARRIEARTRGKGLFMKGLVAKGKITMSGQVEFDSFDSSDPNYSTNGMYIRSKRKDNGDVASNNGSMDIGGQVKIYGSVATGANGSIKISDPSQQKIGTISYIDSGGKGIQDGRYTKDMNVSFPNVEAPFTGGAVFPMQNVTVNGVKYKLVLYSGNYTLSTLSLSGSDKLLVLGNATLLVNQDVSISGSASIQINPGANLQLYVKKGAVSISGQGVANLTGNAANFGLWGMPEMKDIGFSGDGTFIGTIYAPQAKLSLSGGSTTGLDFTGAGIVNEVNASGQYKFHYDEALGNAGGKNLILASWREF